MNHRPPSHSFNTVKHSHREERNQRLKKQRMVALSICVVIVLTLLTLAIFLFCLIADTVNGGNDTPNIPPQNNNGQSGETGITYVSITKENAALGQGELILVSEKLNHAYQYPKITLKSFADPDIHVNQNGVRPYQCTILKSNEQMESTAAYAADAMLTDFYKVFNDSSLIFIDAYRTKEEQSGKLTPVGYSEHETGYVFTLQSYDANGKRTGLSSNPNYLWIYENCAKYGIVCRYPADKSVTTGIDGYDHCFRYVGIPHATYMYQNNLCLEEYVALLQSNYSGATHLQVTGSDGNAYEIYYVARSAGDLTTLSVPGNYAYTISGDNVGGFIVTVNLNAPVA
ncbi:MAG: D-alanyl-D-alanine carboxypeptidase family protein [Clostridia bacterium]|nr:D-alanyl-D-alanine carboxypeptidase family protein [Clostridia bacterium]